MAHLGADRLIDPPLTGMLLAIRRGLIEEMNAASMADYVLVDMAVIAFANAMRHSVDHWEYVADHRK